MQVSYFLCLFVLLFFLRWFFYHNYSGSCLPISVATLLALVFTLVVLLFFLLFSHGAIFFLSLLLFFLRAIIALFTWWTLLLISCGCVTFLAWCLYRCSFHIDVMLKYLLAQHFVVFFVGVVVLLALALLFLSMVLVWYFPPSHYKEFANK